MTPTAEPSPSRPTFRLELRVYNEPLHLEAPQPEGPVRLDGLLPFLRLLDDQVIDRAVQRAASGGGKVSCRKGCSTCCRSQPVPVTPAEAYALLLLVEAMPEPRRGDVRQRFADRVRRLSDAGLLDVFLRRTPVTTREQAREFAEHYFRLGLACPFLEDDACSIYPDRPLVCRQYLVTSPAELCADPFHNSVKPIPLPLAPATAVLRTAAEALGEPQYTVPLVLALDYAEAHRAELERTYPARELFQRCVAALGNPAEDLV
jgi:Fe-S-cluster containining protein